AIAKKQTPDCLVRRAWGTSAPEGTIAGPPSAARCYNPYSICEANRKRALGIAAGDVGPAAPHCYGSYHLPSMNDAELLTLALLHGHEYPDSWNGSKMAPED